MSQRFLQPGETLRIRTRDMILELRPGPCEIRILKRRFGIRLARGLLAWWLRLHRLGAAAGRRYLQRRRENAAARQLAELHPRILKDIGLERWHGGTLAERVHMLRSDL